MCAVVTSLTVIVKDLNYISLNLKSIISRKICFPSAIRMNHLSSQVLFGYALVKNDNV
jgi:hypothetical protein